MDIPIGRDTKERKRMAVVRNGGKTTLTRWTVLQRFGLAVRRGGLETGRTTRSGCISPQSNTPSWVIALWWESEKIVEPRQAEA